ncbi:uncharacterized protein BYT42DRAFT_583734 [Radiomyces spectabilis]|uniref:uncharacterized protein n=1 Tax=Radiomyces spectabilis TaxID=64574 RepID=UPI0022206946|nr:uncharacterized protein BYT42DRAFT_583734 [Radiomyces spectabilis]KAI8369262.1 hypothetical protein BYT42DRAFT_583734 [Radiomyces spectabilis]
MYCHLTYEMFWNVIKLPSSKWRANVNAEIMCVINMDVLLVILALQVQPASLSNNVDLKNFPILGHFQFSTLITLSATTELGYFFHVRYWPTIE